MFENLLCLSFPPPSSLTHSQLRKERCDMRHRQEERSSNKRFRMRQTKQEKAKIEERERNGATSMYIN